MSLRQDQDWATSIYQDRAELVDADEDVTCFFLESYSEICRYMRFIYYDLDARLVGSGLVVVSFETGGEVASQFADAWFEKTDAFVRGFLSNQE